MEFYQWNSKKEWKRVIRLNKNKACSFLKIVGGDLIYNLGKELGIDKPGCPIVKVLYFPSFLKLFSILLSILSQDIFKMDNRVVDVQSTIFGKFLVGRFKGVVKGITAQQETLLWGMGTFKTTKI